MYQIVLASGSPRRKEILKQAGFDFVVKTSEVEEKTSETRPEKVVEELSKIKALDVARQCESQTIIIGADTIVAHRGKILGKPKDRMQAYEMIKELQGNVHEVFTGVTLVIKEGNTQSVITFHECTIVEVVKMNDNEINEYIDSKEPYDKAGGYGIQGNFALYISKIVGDYYNVVGFPVSKMNQILKERGLK